MHSHFRGNTIVIERSTKRINPKRRRINTWWNNGQGISLFDENYEPTDKRSSANPIRINARQSTSMHIIAIVLKTIEKWKHLKILKFSINKDLVKNLKCRLIVLNI